MTAQVRRCNTILDPQELRKQNRAAFDRLMELERFTEAYRQKVNNADPNERLINENGLITIPVVVHIVHNGTAIGVGRNIPDAQIINQINILNQDFRRLNPDANQTPAAFANRVADVNIEFRLACINPQGLGTNGINRIQSNVNSFLPTNQQNDSPLKHTNQGGADAWPTDRYLNIWVSRLGLLSGGQLLGFATNPFNYAAFPDIDGIAVDFESFGSGGNTVAPFDLGRTATHEIGHWLNARHIWGDGSTSCNDTDECDDTPNQLGFTSPGITPVFPNNASCGNGGDMFMNYMDYSADRFMNLFTNDQAIRMRAVFQSGGPRRGFIDNYFRLTQAYASCSGAGGFYIVRTPFCAAQGNINWSITGPATLNNPNGNTATNYALPQNNANGVATITASWNNLAADFTIPIGYGAENSTYNPNYYNSGNVSTTTGSVNMTSYNNWTYGQVSFTGATGLAKNWRLVSCNSCNPQTYFSGSGNSFGVYLTQPYAFATIRAEIPAACGDITIEYSFLGGYLNPGYTLSPNPANNEITISASLPIDPNNRTSSLSTPAYEVQIFNAYNQLMKKTKVKKDDRDVTIDVSRFPSNQFYTVKLISDNDVQTKTFFKQ